MKNTCKKVLIAARGLHPHSGSRRKLSYCKEVDEEIAEWILIGKDAHLPVSTELVNTKAKLLIKPQRASKGWSKKFLICHSLSMCANKNIHTTKTSCSVSK